MQKNHTSWKHDLSELDERRHFGKSRAYQKGEKTVNRVMWLAGAVAVWPSPAGHEASSVPFLHEHPPNIISHTNLTHDYVDREFVVALEREN